MASNRKYKIVFVAGILVLTATLLIALSVGRYPVALDQTFQILWGNLTGGEQVWDDKVDAVIMNLRLPRCIAAILIGAALSLSGACYQSIFKNPMVSPDLLGVSSGACVGAALAMLWYMDNFWIQVMAFAFGIITVFITTLIPRLIRNESTIILVLSGVIMSSLMSSIMALIKYLADTDTKLAEITYWTMGSIATVTLDEIASVLPFLIVPAIVILLMRFRLNVMALGDKEAKSLGVDLRKTRGLFVICATLMTASCVCLAGTVGWIGLVIPHVARLIMGADNKKMLPVALVFGSIFMLVIDTLCRTISGSELKISILTGLVGAPFFFFILWKQHKNLR